MTSPQVPTVTLNNGVEMPTLGFGVYQIPPEDTESAVTTALEIGYRLLDPAPPALRCRTSTPTASSTSSTTTTSPRR